MKSKSKRLAKSFKATLERMEGKLGWVIARIPFHVEKVFGARRPRVKGEINGFSFRTTLFPTASNSHFLLVTKRMQAGAYARTGDTAQFWLEPDLEARKAVMPVELKRAFSQDRALQRWFNNMSFSMRRWICNEVAQPKNVETRVRRAERIAEQLMATMEAEQELPPILKAVFARDPRALEGWQKMTPTQRRYTLLGIFHYRNPESRERRIRMMMEEAVARAAGRGQGRENERAAVSNSFEELE